ncbi:MAG TPA: hypothetical protein VM571_02665, partial [Noviherbaspirillum sp.]|nr:hypothetical protein [Noviherbaspirillum sp.]
LEAAFCSQLFIPDAPLLPDLSGHKFLKSIDISHSGNVTDDVLKYLPESLEEIKASGCKELKGDGKVFSRFTSLKRIGLEHCTSLMDDALHSLSDSVEEINVNGCRLTNKALDKPPSHLKIINISRTGITEAGLVKKLPLSTTEIVAEFTRLRTLSIDNENLSRYTNLRRLDLSSSGLIDEALQHLPESLEELDISYCGRLTTEAKEKLPPSLKVRDL